MLSSNSKPDLTLRSARVARGNLRALARLEGWAASGLLPSFETPRCARLLRMRWNVVTREASPC
jgi:hypothetical protein